MKLTEKELDQRIHNAIKLQPKLAGSPRFALQGWDAAKLGPTIKAVLLEVGLVEIMKGPSDDGDPELRGG